MKNRKFDFRTAYIDLLINLLTGIVVLFLLTTLLIAPLKKNQEGIKKNAEYLITTEWSSDVDCDVDVWIRDPLNQIVSFRNRESGVMYLERDDLGFRKEIYIDPTTKEEKLVNKENKEYITVRGIISGEYILNVHLYSCHEYQDIDEIAKLPESRTKREIKPLSVTVEVIKLNPDINTVLSKKIVLTKIWEERTISIFTITENGIIIKEKDGFISLIKGR